VHDTSVPNTKTSKSQAIAKATSPITNPQNGNAQPKSPLVKPLGQQLDKAKDNLQATKSVIANQRKTKNSRIWLLAGTGVIVILLIAGIVVAMMANR
jgi:hypothetical protein